MGEGGPYLYSKIPSNRYGGNKEFTPIHKIRKGTNLNNETELDIRKSSPPSYYEFFRKSSELQKSMNIPTFREELSYNTKSGIKLINKPINISEQPSYSGNLTHAYKV